MIPSSSYQMQQEKLQLIPSKQNKINSPIDFSHS